jgi:hypothetical protein
METLVSIAVMSIISGGIVLAFSSSMRIISTVDNKTSTAVKLLQIDYFIRDQVDNFHIPYWFYAPDEVLRFKNTIWLSKYGKYIQNIETITDASGITRGIRVFYTANGISVHTDALFPSTPVLEHIE